jgi:hypothetical protein
MSKISFKSRVECTSQLLDSIAEADVDLNNDVVKNDSDVEQPEARNKMQLPELQTLYQPNRASTDR